MSSLIVDHINESLQNIIDNKDESIVKEAAKYSLINGGKRIRPLIICEVVRAYQFDYKKYLTVACAIEMIHTYSLIHDDLPCMDDDDYRRGNLTCHKKYGEAIALLAGDALLNEAVLEITKTDLTPDKKVKIIDILYSCSGIDGMIKGQVMDMLNEGVNCELDVLKEIHLNKTGKLIRAAFEIGAILVDSKQIDIWGGIGEKLGIAFQIQDDVLDCTSSQEVLGKPIGSDIENNKSTYVSLLGLSNSQSEYSRLYDEIISSIENLKLPNEKPLLDLINIMKKREK